MKYNYRTLSVLVFFFLSSYLQSFSQATVMTDSLNYVPGDTAFISGSGFAPLDTVTVQVIHVEGSLADSDYAEHQPWEVTADSSGNISTYWVVPHDAFGTSLVVIAFGETGDSAEYYFYDGLGFGNYQSRKSGNWNNPTTWIEGLTGTSVTFTNGSTTVTGTSTSFLSQLAVGDSLMLQSSAGITRGAVASIQSNTQLTLTAPDTVTASGAYGKQAAPTSSSSGTIEIIGGTTVTVTATVSASNQLTVDTSGQLSVNSSDTLTLAVAAHLYVYGTMNLNGYLLSDSAAYLTVTGIFNINDTASLKQNNTLYIYGGNVNIASGGALYMNASGTLDEWGNITAHGNGYISAGGELHFGTITLADSSIFYLDNSFTLGTPSAGPTLLIVAPKAKVAGGSNFSVNSGATLEIGSAAGITSSGAAGSIQNTGARSYGTGANYIYNGTAAQVTGNGLPTGTITGNITDSNTIGLTPTNSIATSGTLTVTGLLIPTSSQTISGSGTLTGNGTVQITRTASTADFSSQYTITNKTLGNITVNYAGTAGQTVSALTYGNLQISDSSNVTLGGNATVNGTLTFTKGKIITGSYTLSLDSTASISGAAAGQYIYGIMLWDIPTGSPSPTFCVGDSTNYTPVTISFNNVTTPGTLTAQSNKHNDPNIATSGIDSTKDVKRYWTLTNASTAFTSCNATFNFVSSDITGGPNPLYFSLEKYSSSAWSLLSTGTLTSTSSQATGVTSFGAFQIGNLKCTVNPPVASTSVTAVSCNGANSGSASAGVTGGTSPFSYSWSTGATTTSISGLTAATYTVTITDVYGCSSSATAAITQPSALTVSTAHVNELCNGGSSGSATATATGGTGSDLYSWSTGATTTAISGLSAATYTVTVTDANSCEATGTATITQPSALTASTMVVNISCHGDSNGIASAVADGGTSPYMYLWSNGATTSTISGLSVATYTVIVTDADSCIAITTATITQPAAVLTAAITSSTNVWCQGGSTGAATVAASGGTTPYYYLWSPTGETSASATGLAVAIHTATITDTNGCSTAITDTIKQLYIPITGDTSFCEGSSITLDAGSGYSTYLWSTGQTTESITVSSSNSISDQLKMGIAGAPKPFDLLKLSINGSGYFQLAETEGGGAVAYTQDGEFSENADGIIVHSPSGYFLYPQISFPWDMTAMRITPDGIFKSLVPYGEDSTVEGQIQLAMFTDSSQLTSLGNGIYESTVGSGFIGTYDPGSGGTGPLVSNYPFGATFTGDFYFELISSLGDFAYTRNGAEFVDSAGSIMYGSSGYTLIDLSIPSDVDSIHVNADGTVYEQVTGETTYEQEASLILVHFINPSGLASLGNNLYTESESSGSVLDITPVEAATFIEHIYSDSVNVTDAYGCLKIGHAAGIILPTPPRPIITASGITRLCPGASITLDNDDSIFYYPPILHNLWNNSDTTEQVTVSAVGNYYSTVTNTIGCSSVSDTVTITHPATLTASITGSTNVNCAGNNNGNATVAAAAGIPPYSYLWSPSGQTTSTLSGLAPGYYSVLVTDSNGCLASANTTILFSLHNSPDAAIPFEPYNIYADYEIGDTVLWFSFIAYESTLTMTLTKPLNTADTTGYAIFQSAKLYAGSADSLSLLGQWNAAVYDSGLTEIHINFSGLTAGSPYYLELQRVLSECDSFSVMTPFLTAPASNSCGGVCNLVGNGDFSQVDTTCRNNNLQEPFEDGCVTCWTCSHGSPQIEGSPNDWYALMWAAGNQPGTQDSAQGEGILTTLHTQLISAGDMMYIFQMQYRLDSSIALSPVPSFTIHANLTTPGGVNDPLTDHRFMCDAVGGYPPDPPADSTFEILDQYYTASTHNWVPFSTCIDSAQIANYHNLLQILWIYPTTADSTVTVDVDSINLYPVDANLGPDICVCTSATLQPVNNCMLLPGLTYQWKASADPSVVLATTYSLAISSSSVPTTYSLTITYGSCSVTGSIVVNPPDSCHPPETILPSPTQICSTNDSSVTFSTNPAGINNWQVQWSSGGDTSYFNTTATAVTFSVSPSETYTVNTTFTNNDGCTGSATKTFHFLPEPALTVNTFSGPCVNNQYKITANIVSYDSCANYTFQWYYGASVVDEVPGAASDTVFLGPGTYTVVANDKGGCYCSGIATVTVGFNATVTSAGAFNCDSGGTADILVTNSSNVNDIFSYVWSGTDYSTTPATIKEDTTYTITVSTPGTYTVTVTDSSGCYLSDTVTLTNYFTADVSYSYATCTPPYKLAKAVIKASGGAGNTYSYLWSTGDTTSSDSLAGGVYTYTVTSGYYCKDTGTVTIVDSPNVVISVNPDPAFICHGDSVTLTASGASSFIWNTGATTSSIKVSPSVTTTYTVTGIDTGCVGLTTVSVNILPPPPAPVVTVTNYCGYSKLSTTATGFLNWSTGASTSSITITADSIALTGDSIYTLTTINDSGCISAAASDTARPMPLPPTPVITVHNSYNCAGSAGLVASNYTGTLHWNTGSNESDIVTTESTTWTLYQTVNGCNSLKDTAVTAPLTTPDTPIVYVYDFCDSSKLYTTDAGALLWSTGATTFYIWVTTAGTYSVTASDSSCTSAAGTGVAAPRSVPAISISPRDTIICATGSVNLTASGADIYVWSAPSDSDLFSCTNCATTTATPYEDTSKTATRSTIYTVIGTNTTSGCSATDTTSVTQLSVLTAPTIAQNATFCGVCLTLNPPFSDSLNLFGGIPPYYIQWYENSSPDGLNVLYDSISRHLCGITISGDYGAYITDYNGCETSVEINGITALPDTFTIMAPPNASFCKNGSGVVLTAGGANSYTWSPSTGLSDTTGATVYASPASTTIYSVTGTDVNGCSNTQTVTVTVNTTCCADSNGVTDIDDSGYISSGTYTGTYTLNGSVVIASGDTVAFQGLTLLINSGVYIMIDSGAVLTLRSNCNDDTTNYLHTCDDTMWVGIIVESGGTLNIIDSCNLIEDAQYAVQADSGSTVSISGGTFNKDFAGIYMPPKPGGKNVVKANIRNCYFTCTANLKPAFSGQTPAPLTHTFAGIYINDLTLLMLLGRNTFDSLNNGIYAANSNLTVIGGTYNNIITYDEGYDEPYGNDPDYEMYNEQYGLPTGYGIIAEGISPRSLSFTGNGAVTNFTNCATGIFASNMNTKIHGAKIIDLIYAGIVIEDAAGLNTDVSGNNISTATTGGTAMQTAISLYQNVSPDSMSVNGNTIIMQNPNSQNSIGIHVVEWPFSPLSTPTIVGNNIWMANTQRAYGICLASLESYTAQGNNVYLSSGALPQHFASYYGIYAVNSPGTNLSCNTIKGQTFANESQSGTYSIYTFTNLNYFYKCNTVDSTYDGFYFQNGISKGLLESNYIKHHKYGLYVNKNAFMGPQRLQGNQWLDSMIYKFGASDSNIIHSNYEKDKFLVSPVLPYLPSISSIDINWFAANDSAQANCGSIEYPYCGAMLAPGGGGIRHILYESLLSPMDSLIARDSIHTADFDDQIAWSAQRFLMEELLVNDSLISQDTAVTTFYTTHISDNIGTLSSIRLQMDTMNNVDSTTKAAIQSNLDTIYKYSNGGSSMTELDTSGGGGSSGSDSLYNIYMAAINTAIAANDSIYNIIQSTVKIRASTINSGNNALSSSLIYEQNEIAVNNIYLSTVAINRPDSLTGYATQLYNIARQCALSGGNAVSLARSLYAAINDTIVFDDDQICSSPSDTCLVPPSPGLISGRASAVCGLEFSYSIDSMNNVTGYTWSLTGNAVIDSIQGSTRVWVSFSDTFTTGAISVYATDSCGSGMPRTLAITGYPNPPASISGASAVCAFASDLSFSCDSSCGAMNYTWVVPPGCTIDSGQGTTRVVVDWDSLPGNVIVVASDSCGTSDSTEYAVSITECREAANHNIAAVPASGDIKIYPNPTNGMVTVIYHLNSSGVLQLFNVVGQLVGSFQLDGNNNFYEFDASYLCCGIFEYRVMDNETLKGQGKLVIIR